TIIFFLFFFSSRRRHTRLQGDWSSDVCSSDLSLNDLVDWGLRPPLLVVSDGAPGLIAAVELVFPHSLAPTQEPAVSARRRARTRSEERRVGKECRSRRASTN